MVTVSDLLVIERNGKFYLVFVVDINVALMKPAQLSSKERRFPYATAATAVDGNKEARFRSQSCTHTRESPADNKPWWRVDLSQLYHVHSVQITNRLGSKCVCLGLKDSDKVTDSPDPAFLQSYITQMVTVI